MVRHWLFAKPARTVGTRFSIQNSIQAVAITKKGNKKWRIKVERHTGVHKEVSLRKETTLSLLKSIKKANWKKRHNLLVAYATKTS